MDFTKYIRDIPNFPKPGILFKDITPLLSDPTAFRASIDRFAEEFGSQPIDAISAAEARGFLFAAPLAYLMKKPLIPDEDWTNGGKLLLGKSSDLVLRHD